MQTTRYSYAEEIISLDVEAEKTYNSKIEERKEIIAKAKEKALKLLQQAAKERGNSREAAILSHDAAMHKMKDSIVAIAQAEAEALTARAQTRREDAINKVLAATQE